MCVFSLFKMGRLMLESLRKIGMLKMPKAKPISNKDKVSVSARKEAVRLLKSGMNSKDVSAATGITGSTVRGYKCKLK
tara:strand:- start:32997 stop:33230 length:234 start_codon:yes stop_codon:yes gene_type:complete